MARNDGSIVYSQCLGSIETLPSHAIPDGYVRNALNVRMSPYHAFRPRPGGSALNLTSGPTALVRYLFRENAALWAFTGTTPSAYRLSSGSWSTVSLIDTAGAGEVSAVAYNGKVFLAYNSAENRLHLWDGSAVRRVGVIAPSAPTVANTGSGSYAATLRYYKVQMRLYRAPGTTAIIAVSELSAAQSFTPSGAGTAARVTKPTTTDSATHWVVFGSADGITYYAISGAIDVATTTFDDSTDPSAYSTVSGTVAPEAGLNVPPPSCKFLATNGERIFMAGAFETSASSGQTTPASRRVWFTRPLGATGQGDDETVTQTTDSRYYLDIDNNDGSEISGLCSAVDGTIYVGTPTSLWRLYETGDSATPFRPDRVVPDQGPLTHYLLGTGDPRDQSRVYFMSASGPFRYSPGRGLEWLGEDWVNAGAGATLFNPQAFWAVGFDTLRGLVFWTSTTSLQSATARVLDPVLQAPIGGVLRGGWSTWQYAYGSDSRAYAALSGETFYLGGQADASTGLIWSHLESGTVDDGTSPAAFTASLSSKVTRLGDGSKNFSTQEPYFIKPRAMALTAVVQRNFGGTNNEVTKSISAESPAGGEPVWHRHKAENLVVADAYTVGLSLSASAHVSVTTGEPLDGIVQIIIPTLEGELG